ncbi:MAG: ABC transporter permease [Chloroflexi bacterium]|nr:ABC transporter permease [Chloroflexota bacterium]
MVLKNLWRRKTRTSLTVAGIAIGIAVVVALRLLADGLTGQISALMAGGGAEITLMQDGIADMSFSALDEELGASILNMPDVQWVSGLLLQIGPVGEKSFFVTLGLEPQSEAMRHFRLIKGEMLQAETEMLLGRMAADFFHRSPGDVLTIQGRSFRIAGVYETGVGFEDAGGVIPLATAQQLFKKPGQVSFYQIRLQPEARGRIDALLVEIEERFPAVVAYRSGELARNTPDIRTFQTLAAAMSFIGLLAGALGTMNTMLMSVFERTREIGTLRALGWRKRWVMGMVLGESLAVSLIGGLVGVALGVGLAFLVSAIPAVSGYFVPRVSAGSVVTGLVVALGLGTLGGLYPAWRAARLQPIEALRYE